jgi:hypothetical protein
MGTDFLGWGDMAIPLGFLYCVYVPYSFVLFMFILHTWIFSPHPTVVRIPSIISGPSPLTLLYSSVVTRHHQEY